MTATIERLRAYMQSSGACKIQQGRVVEREMVDNVMRGLQVIMTKKASHRVEDGIEEAGEEDLEVGEIGAADLEVH
jgi:hypothetical protein